jgi:hypothetical protein
VKQLVLGNQSSLFQKLFTTEAILMGKYVNALDKRGQDLLRYAVDAENIWFIARVLKHIFTIFKIIHGLICPDECAFLCRVLKESNSVDSTLDLMIASNFSIVIEKSSHVVWSRAI